MPSADGTLECFGANSPETPDGPVLDFALESNGACGVFADGHIECWEDPAMWDPETMSWPAGTFVAVAVGRTFVCGIKAAGDMLCAGDTWEHTPDNQGFIPSPKLIGGPFTSIDSQYLTTCGLLADGHPSCWWSNHDATVWGVVPDLAFAQIGLGESGGCGVLLDGGAVCWGSSAIGPEVLNVPSLE